MSYGTIDTVRLHGCCSSCRGVAIIATAHCTSASVGSSLLLHSLGPADVLDCEPELVGGTSCDAGGLCFILLYLSVHFQLLSVLIVLVGLFGSVCGSSWLSFSWFVSLSVLLVLLVQYLSVLMSTAVVVCLSIAVVVPVILCA